MEELDTNIRQLLVEYDQQRTPAFKGDIAAWKVELNLNKHEMAREIFIQKVKQVFYNAGYVIEEDGQVPHE